MFFCHRPERKNRMFWTTFALLMTIGANDATWHEDYSKATKLAIEEKKDLVIHFYGRDNLDAALGDAAVKKKLSEFVCLRLPIDYKFQDKRLLDYPVLADMRGYPGLVVVSYHDDKSPTFCTPISIHPLIGSRYHWVPAYGPTQVLITLHLPAKATLTQRSMIYAV